MTSLSRKAVTLGLQASQALRLNALTTNCAVDASALVDPLARKHHFTACKADGDTSSRRYLDVYNFSRKREAVQLLRNEGSLLTRSSRQHRASMEAARVAH